MILVLHTDASARATFAATEQWDDDHRDHGAHPTGAMLRTLADLDAVLSARDLVEVCRDWEGCPIIVVNHGAGADGLPASDILAFRTDGAIAHGGVNLPHPFYPTVAAYLVAHLS